MHFHRHRASSSTALRIVIVLFFFFIFELYDTAAAVKDAQNPRQREFVSAKWIYSGALYSAARYFFIGVRERDKFGLKFGLICITTRVEKPRIYNHSDI